MVELMKDIGLSVWSSSTLLSAATRTLPRRCATSAIVCMSGDAVAQHAIEYKLTSKHDYTRSARLGIYGGVIFAPIMNAWFTMLSKIVHHNLAIQTAARVVVDQVAGGPLMPVIFYTSLTLMEGGTIQQVKAKLKAAWFRTWTVGVCVFTPASIINQSVIAPQNRVLFINGVALCWNVFLSYTNNKHRNVDLISEFNAIKENEG